MDRLEIRISSWGINAINRPQVHVEGFIQNLIMEVF